jgi:hypothetical protein
LALAIAAAFLVFLYQIAYRFIPSVEGTVFNVAAAATLLTGPFLFLFVLLHTYRLLGQYRELLRQLALLPMTGAYERLPLKISFTFGRFLSNFTPRVSNLTLAVQQYESLLEKPATPKRRDGNPFDRLQREIADAHDALLAERVCDSFQAEFKLEDDPLQFVQSDYRGNFKEGEVILTKSATMSGLVRSAQHCLVPLRCQWEHRTAAQGYPESAEPGTRHDNEAYRDEEGDSPPSNLALAHQTNESNGSGSGFTAWLDRAEELVALVTVTYVSQFALHLANNVMYLTACPLLLLVAVNSYPFQPHRFLALFYWTLSLSTLLIVLMFMVILDRDEFLSRIAKTRPSYFAWSSLSVLLKYFVPLIAILVTQHPDVSDTLYTYLGTLLRVIEK